MNKKISKLSVNAYPLLMILGGCVLLFRTIRLLIFEDGLIILASWVKGLTFIEMIIDSLCVYFSIKWIVRQSLCDKAISLKLGATAALFHAFRVLIYVVGRVGPWKDFDKTPEHRFSKEVDLFWVYFAGILSILGVMGVALIRRTIKRRTFVT